MSERKTVRLTHTLNAEGVEFEQKREVLAKRCRDVAQGINGAKNQWIVDRLRRIGADFERSTSATELGWVVQDAKRWADRLDVADFIEVA